MDAGAWEGTYGDLEIDHLLDPGAHLVVEAEAIFALLFRCEHKVALALFRALHYYPVIGANYAVIDVEGAA